MRTGFRPKFFKKHNRINNQITGLNFRVLDAEGKQIGIFDRYTALKMAEENGIDLVEISGNAVPPVVKLIDYNKFLYQLKKKKQEEKKKTSVSETKEIRMRPFIGDHDLDIKLSKAREFIQDGDKVRFVVKFSGREITKKNIGEELMKRIFHKLSDVAKIEREAHMEGRQLVSLISRLK